MIEKIRDFVLDLLRIGILRGNDDLGRLFAHLLEDLIQSLLKEIVCVRSGFWVFPAICDRIIDGLEYLKGIFRIPLCPYDGRIETCSVSCMAGGSYLLHLR